ncbi:MAG TPA: septum formation protein Maf [Lachnospiraceae bacterium]|nr:septum formation protein Maf [Lachnospiraceae bacterium]
MSQTIQFVLASQSPRRKELLQRLGISFQVITSATDERVSSSDPAMVTSVLANRKAMAVAEGLLCQGGTLWMRQPLIEQGTFRIGPADKASVIGADTVVVIDGQIIGKPGSVVEARKMMHLLQGRTHEVYTGVAILTLQDGHQDRGRTFHDKTIVHVGELDEIELEEYITSPEPYDKAGGYGIQGEFAKYITGIEGDYYNVVGLPINKLYQELKKLGIRL